MEFGRGVLLVFLVVFCVVSVLGWMFLWDGKIEMLIEEDVEKGICWVIFIVGLFGYWNYCY